MSEIYGSVSEYRAYHTARGRDTTAQIDAIITAKLLVASEWIDARFRKMFPGLKTGLRSQEREWPRTGAYDIYGYTILSNDVPDEVKKATYEATYVEIESNGSLSVSFTPSQYKSVSVDGAVSAEYAGHYQAASMQTDYAIINEILQPILVNEFSRLSGGVYR